MFVLISQEFLTVGTLNYPFICSVGISACAPARLMISLWIHSQRGQNDKKNQRTNCWSDKENKSLLELFAPVSCPPVQYVN